MIGKSIALALLATAMIGGGAVNRAEALVAAPATVSITTTGDAIQNVAWVCGPTRCDWQPWLPLHQHSWARSWSAPRSPGCFWEKRRGRWREVCPR
jgi:hypothetical protein